MDESKLKFQVRKYDFDKIKNSVSKSRISNQSNINDSNRKKSNYNSAFPDRNDTIYQNSLISLMDQFQPRDQMIIFPYKSANMMITPSKEKKKILEWIGDMQFAVTSASFRHYIENNLSFNEVKVYCSENLMINLLLFLQKVNPNESQYAAKLINETMKINLQYLQKKYPLTNEGSVNKKLREAILKIQKMEDDENDLIEKVNLVFKPNPEGDHTSQIMSFINELIKLSESQYIHLGTKKTTFSEGFNQLMQKIFESAYIPQNYYSQEKLINHLTTKPNLETNLEEKGNILFKPYKQLIEKVTPEVQKELKQYKQKVVQYTSFTIGQKINKNTNLYTENQIKMGDFTVKSTAILRIMTKWIQQLSNKLINSKQMLLNKTSNFKTNQVGQFMKLESSERGKLYQATQYYQKQLEKLEAEIYDECIQTEANLAQQSIVFKQEITIPKHQFFVGIFGTKLQTTASIYLLYYLNWLINVLLKIPEQASKRSKTQNKKDDKAFCSEVNLITFKIGDLLRCKCTSHEQQILRIYRLIEGIHKKNPSFLRIIRIKDRLEMSTRDILLNIKFNDRIMCEIQLSISDEIHQKKKMYNKFTHYLYELKRSFLGPLMECSCVWAHLDQRSQEFKKFLSFETKQDNFWAHKKINECPHLNFKPYNYPFSCSICKKFFLIFKGLIDTQQCIECKEFYKCRDCINIPHEQLMDKFGLIKGLKNFHKQNLKIWKYQEGKTLPQFGFAISKKSKILNREFFQAVTVASEVYLIKFYESENETLNFSYIFKCKETDIQNVEDQFYIVELKDDRVNHSIIISDFNQKLQQGNLNKKKQRLQKEEQINLQKKKRIQQRRQDFGQGLFKHKSKQNNDQVQQEKIQQEEKESIEGNLERKEIITVLSQHSKMFDMRACNYRDETGIINQIILGFYVKDYTIKKQLFRQKQMLELQQIIETNQIIELQNTYIEGQSFEDVLRKNLHLLSHIKMITFAANKLSSLGFVQMLSNLQTLTLKQNFIIDMSPISKLMNLKKIDLSHNKIQIIEEVSNRQRLISLNLSMNCISKLENIYGNPKLKFVELSCNSISKIEAMTGCPSITTLNLSSNELISQIENLENLTELEKLDLSHNSISEVKGLKCNPNLQSLNLSINKISLVETEEISQLASLTSLKLSNNLFKFLDYQAINTLKHLQQLYLGNNQLQLSKYEKQQSKLMLPTLKRLFLEGNKIRDIVLEKFNCLPHLQYLDLRYNRIKFVPDGLLDTLPKIKKINLRIGNPIKNDDFDNIHVLKNMKKKHKLGSYEEQG